MSARRRRLRPPLQGTVTLLTLGGLLAVRVCGLCGALVLRDGVERHTAAHSADAHRADAHRGRGGAASGTV